ncbi:DUF6884 domain-containing protein [Actinacidiphila paucisporea]|uniref:DUF6884 domain-containing protein n=1 Tax=Actinacidiphila paucisporea TaxID=310782 RepID=A0A1M7PF72_9ACTN|nr:DUF6884 domain-containing protein [Actinacidiphila paucisporea]SHN15606.1 hypothetical protein SAMN05216499_12325 [Actinacidiphila paucisporea]
MPPNEYLDCFAAELVVVPCGARKLDVAARAADMYTGSYHRACRRAAEALRPERLLILSARYGLLGLDDVIEPYDTPHGAAGAVSAGLVREQAARRGIDRLDPVVVLGGARHVALAQAVWPYARTPLSGTRGMGEQVARLAAMARSTGTARGRAS